jgi:PAS domain S-box-containing protein
LKVEVQRRKDMHAALVESREKYRALFRTFPIGVAITDNEGNIIEANRALHRLTGLKDIAGIQRIGSRAGDLIKPDGSEVSREYLARVRALREHRRIEDEEVGLLRPDGSRVWFNAVAAPIPVRGYGVVAAYSDVTERKQAIEREKRQQAEFTRAARLNVMGEMASALAHELGQPLSSCLNYLEGLILRLAAGTADEADVAAALASARHQAEQAGEIVKRVRNYVRRHRPERSFVDINEIIGDVVSFLRFEARSHGADVHLVLGQCLPAAFVDRVEIEQVVLNLLKNAIDAVGAVPERRRVVSIATRTRGNRLIECLVSDHGCGVPTEGLNRVFEPYFTTKADGLGLGLSICRTIIESHEGTLKAMHNQPHGAKFSFTLPVREAIT